MDCCGLLWFVVVCCGSLWFVVVFASSDEGDTPLISTPSSPASASASDATEFSRHTYITGVSQATRNFACTVPYLLLGSLYYLALSSTKNGRH